jgi:hypothetical protein
MIILLYFTLAMLYCQCQFLNNTAQAAGALSVSEGISLSITRCLFDGNTAGKLTHNTSAILYSGVYRYYHTASNCIHIIVLIISNITVHS